MSLHSLKDLLANQVRDLHSAQLQYLDILPSMIASATDADLAVQLSRISDDVRQGTGRLERACELLGVPPTGVTCEAMRGLVREARQNVVEVGDGYVIDAALIANSQRIAHYQIAGFGTARQFARIVQADEVAEILDELAKLAGDHDRELNKVANGGWFSRGVNQYAEAGRAGGS